jgi:UrcA family protein
MNSNIKTGSRTLLAVSSAVVLACVFGASNAFADDQIRVETVKFQDVNVRSPAGIVTLYQRIHAAAKRVCSESDKMRQTEAVACARKAETHAIEELDLPLLIAYHQAKTGGGTQPLSASR